MTEKNYEVHQIPMDQILCDDIFNCRGKIVPMEVIDLAKDIATNGLQTPITLEAIDNPKYKYKIIAGHRRYTAFKINASATIPAFIEKFEDEFAARAYNLKENLLRANLTLLQEAKALKPFFDKRVKISSIATMLNRSPGWVEVRKQLLELPDDVQEESSKGVINQNHIKGLHLLRNSPEKLYEALRKLKEQASKGQKVIHIKPQETILTLMKIRKPTGPDLNDFLECLNSNILSKQTSGDYFPARLTAWFAGNISKLEIYTALKRECDRLGLPFTPPEDITDALKGYIK